MWRGCNSVSLGLVRGGVLVLVFYIYRDVSDAVVLEWICSLK